MEQTRPGSSSVGRIVFVAASRIGCRDAVRGYLQGVRIGTLGEKHHGHSRRLFGFAKRAMLQFDLDNGLIGNMNPKDILTQAVSKSSSAIVSTILTGRTASMKPRASDVAIACCRQYPFNPNVPRRVDPKACYALPILCAVRYDSGERRGNGNPRSRWPIGHVGAVRHGRAADPPGSQEGRGKDIGKKSNAWCTMHSLVTHLKRVLQMACKYWLLACK